MAFCYFCIGSSYSSFSLFPLFISQHGGNASDIGILMGVLSLSSVVCRPWTSEMVDRIGRKKSFTIGSFLMTALPAGYLFFDGALHSFFVPLLLVRIMHGIGFAISITAAFTYAADIIPKERLSEGIGVFGISGLSGMAFGPVFAEAVIRSFNFAVFFVAASSVSALGLLIHLVLPESCKNLEVERRKNTVSFFGVMRQRRIITVALLTFLFGFGLAASGSFVAPFAQEKQVGFISLYFIAYSLAAVATRIFGGKWADRLGEIRMIPFALTMTGAGLLVMPALNGSAVLILSGFMTGLGHGFLYPSLNALAVRREPAPIRGKITGIFTGSMDAGTFAGSIMLGYVGEYAGFPVLFLAAGLALLSGLLVFKLRLPAR